MVLLEKIILGGFTLPQPRKDKPQLIYRLCKIPLRGCAYFERKEKSYIEKVYK